MGLLIKSIVSTPRSSRRDLLAAAAGVRQGYIYFVCTIPDGRINYTAFTHTVKIFIESLGFGARLLIVLRTAGLFKYTVLN